MKVLMLGWELPPHHTGGMGVACFQLCRSLAEQGADIEYILPFEAQFPYDFMKITAANPGKPESVLTSGGVYDTMRYNPQGTNVSSEFPSLHEQVRRYESGVTELVKLGEFDIIHAHDWLTFRAALAAKLITGKPLIVHIHATEYDRSAGGTGNPLVREIEYAGLMMADQVVAVSDAVKQTIVREYNIPPAKIQVAHNSFEIDRDAVIETESTYRYLSSMKEQGYRVVANAGRLTIQKGLYYFLKAAREVVAKEPKVLFLIAGGGEQLHELLALSAELGIAEHVIFTGYLNGTGKAWRDAFRVADIFVMPSVSEPFGIAPLEAIAYGTPSIVSKQSGVSEIMNNFLKVDFWDVGKMADMICAAVRYPALREELRTSASNEFERLSWKPSATKLMNIYAQHSQALGAVA